MLLEWVDQSSLRGNDASGKRKVRSQAMKNFRSRQRAERQAAVNLALDEAARRSAKNVNQPEVPDQPKPRKKRRLSPCSIHGEVQGPAPPDSTAVVPVSVPRSPTQWDQDAFRSPIQIDQIIGFCASYLHQLRPTISFGHGSAIISTAWKTSPCLMLLAACSLAGAGEVQHASQPEGIYKAKVLHELRERMQFPETAQSDETIAALMFLTSFDLSRANIEARTHLSALNGILRQKHGDHIPLRSSMMLETLDLISAIMFHTQPLTTPSTLLRTPSAWEMSEVLAGLLSADSIAAHPSKLHGLNTLLSSAFAAVQATIINATMGGVVYETFYNSLEDFRLTNCRDLDEGDTGISHIARVIYHQHAILYNLAANARPYAHPSNTRHVTGLCLAIEAEPWRGMPFLRLMVLLTGLAASREAAKKAFFKARLVGAIYEMGVARWVEVREFVGMFLVGREFLEGRAAEVVDSVSPDEFGAARSWEQVESEEVVLDAKLRDQLAARPSPPKTNINRQRKVQEILDMDRGFHDVIRRGDCWLTEHA